MATFPATGNARTSVNPSSGRNPSFVRSPLPPVSNRYYQPIPQPKPQPAATNKYNVPKKALSQNLERNTARLKGRELSQQRLLRKSIPSVPPTSLAPLPSPQSIPSNSPPPSLSNVPRSNGAPLARSVSIPGSQSLGRLVKSIKGFRPGPGGVSAIAELAGEAYYKARGWPVPKSQQQSAEELIRDIGSGELSRQSSESLSNTREGLRNFSRNVKNELFDLFDQLADPFKKKPRTDPKNDDTRSKPERFTYQWQGVKFWSPNNRRLVQIACPNGQYSLGELKDGFGALNYASAPGSSSEIYQSITWENLIAGSDGSYRTQSAEVTCDPATIEPDPTYIPPSYQLPVLTRPDGTTPDISDYPPIFTQDDFAPQRQQNDDQAREDEADRQAAPDQNQQRQAASDRQTDPQPDPWESPTVDPTNSESPQPQPQPYPYPLDETEQSTAPDGFPDTSLGDRLREKVERIQERLQESFPAPERNPQPEVTINGEPINQRSPLPSPNLTPRPDPNPQPEVTINGEPQPRPGDPQPDTRQRRSTETKAPTQNRTDTSTGTTPKTEPTPKPTEPTPDRCKDPCIQGLHDKADKKNPVSITVKVFKSCSKPVPEGQTVNPRDVETEDRTIKVPGDEVEAYKLLYARLLTLEAQQCGDVKATATVPEWWQLRRGANVPQLVILFAEVFPSGKLGESRWSLSIPHYNRPKGARPSIADYKKGNWFGSLKLTDGSKLGINAFSSIECKKILNRLKIHIPVEFRTIKGKAIKPRIVEDPNANFKECKVTPIRADYYPLGQANMQPDWTIDLRKK